MTDQKIHRALIALDAAGVPRVLATDSATIAYEFDDRGTDAAEIGILNAKDIGPGLWLWEGKVTARDHSGHEDIYPEWVMDYEGTLAPVGPDGEMVKRLFDMVPPDPEFEEEDRESPGV